MIEINLLPWREDERRRQRRAIKILFFLIIIFVMLSVKLFKPTHSSPPINKPFKMTPRFVSALPHGEMISNVIDEHAELLTQTPLQQLRFVGFLSKENKTIAFLQAPNHITFFVKVGDVVGRERAQIIFLNEQIIILKLNQQTIQRNFTDVL